MRFKLIITLVFFFFNNFVNAQTNAYNKDSLKQGKWIILDTQYCRKAVAAQVDGIIVCGTEGMIVKRSEGKFKNGLKIGQWITVETVIKKSDDCYCFTSYQDKFVEAKLVEDYDNGVCIQSNYYIKLKKSSNFVLSEHRIINKNKTKILVKKYSNDSLESETEYNIAGGCNRPSHYKNIVKVGIGVYDAIVACSEIETTYYNNLKVIIRKDYNTLLAESKTLDKKTGEILGEAKYPILNSFDYGLSIKENRFYSPNYILDYYFNFDPTNYYYKEYNKEGKLTYEEYIDSSYAVLYTKGGFMFPDMNCSYGGLSVTLGDYSDSIYTKEFYVKTKKYESEILVEETLLPLVYSIESKIINELKIIQAIHYDDDSIAGGYIYYDETNIDSTFLSCYIKKYSKKGDLLEYTYIKILEGKMMAISENGDGKIIRTWPSEGFRIPNKIPISIYKMWEGKNYHYEHECDDYEIIRQ